MFLLHTLFGFQYQNKDFIIIVFYSLIITLRLEVN